MLKRTRGVFRLNERHISKGGTTVHKLKKKITYEHEKTDALCAEAKTFQFEQCMCTLPELLSPIHENAVIKCKRGG